ncbi:MAG TPA: GPR endopeptidase [Clostridia bacterium]|nr:GPR endopeptidase [Clostridia bacterium]
MNEYSVYTDLALEAREIYAQENGQDHPGIIVKEDKYEHSQVTRVQLTTEEAARNLNKKIGNYITIESKEIRHNSKLIEKEISQIIAQEIKNLIKVNENATILIVGLGNWNSTPDSLGPKVIKHIFVTRHLQDYVPLEFKHKLRPTCAIAPGVLGITGMETGEIIKGIVERIKPELVLAIDALAARNLERLGTTIQIADTGIHPGSGLGSKRIGLTKETLGIPVIALGVPTVVHAGTIAYDTVEELLDNLTEVNTNQAFNDLQISSIIEKILAPYQDNLMVTPKEIDRLIDDMSIIIANGINSALHPKLDLEEVMKYFY